MATPKIKQEVLIWLGYGGFFVCCFLLFCYWSFPYERVRDYMMQQVAQSSGPGGVTTELKIGELRPYWLTGIELTDVDLRRSSAEPGAAPIELHADSITARASILSMIVGNTSLNYTAVVGAGEIAGSYDIEPDKKWIQLSLQDVDLATLGIGSALGVPMTGVANGELELTLAEESAETQGNVHIELSGLSLGDGKAKVKIPGMRDGLTIDKVDAGDFELRAAIREGRAELEAFRCDGKDLKVNGSGSLRIGSSLRRSRLDMTVELAFTDAYKQRSDRTKALFQLMGMQLKRATTADGALRFQILGPLSNLRTRQAGKVATGKKRKTKGKRKRKRPGKD